MRVVVVMHREYVVMERELGLQHVEVRAKGDYVLDLACRTRCGGSYHDEHARKIVDGPPTCLWCAAAR